MFAAVVEQLRSSVASLTARVSSLEKGCKLASGPATQPAAPEMTKKQSEAEDSDDDDFELFGSDDDEVITG